MLKDMRFLIQQRESFQEVCIQVPFVLGVGYSGRTSEKVKEHVAELVELGVSAPKEIPMFFFITSDRLTSTHCIDVQGKKTNGEVEYVLFKLCGEWFVTVGSDHTDREIESFSIEKSKQMCPNIIAQSLWPMKDVADHWDELILQSLAVKDNTTTLYQEESLAAIISPINLLEIISQRAIAENLNNVPIFTGTIPTKGGLIFADAFEVRLKDPVIGRSITHKYYVNVL